MRITFNRCKNRCRQTAVNTLAVCNEGNPSQCPSVFKAVFNYRAAEGPARNAFRVWGTVSCMGEKELEPRMARSITKASIVCGLPSWTFVPLVVNVLQIDPLPHSEGVPISGNIEVVFSEVVGETVMAVSVADEVEKLCLRRMHGSCQRSLSGIRNRPRR